MGQELMIEGMKIAHEKKKVRTGNLGWPVWLQLNYLNI